jgi:hypothetical protein
VILPLTQAWKDKEIRKTVGNHLLVLKPDVRIAVTVPHRDDVSRHLTYFVPIPRSSPRCSTGCRTRSRS